MDVISHNLFSNNNDSDDDEDLNLNLQRRNIRASSNIMLLNEKEFKSLFRLSKVAFNFVFATIEEKYSVTNSTGIAPIIKFAATLRFLAQGSYQKRVDQDLHLGLSQQSTSNVIAETLNIIENNMCNEWITLQMSESEKRDIKNKMYQISGIPGVIGCVDGSQIKIIKPIDNEHIYYSRKGYHAVNAMFICDDNMRIRAVNATHGESCHDSMVWNLSAEHAYMMQQWNNDKHSWLLGDSGYPLQPWLMTPFRPAAADSAESRFNTAHSKTRNIIERCIGMLKGRFRCLLAARELHYNPKKVSQIVNVCSVLHNICIHFSVSFDEGFDEPDNEVDDGQDQETSTTTSSTDQNEARRIRDQIRVSYL